MTSFYTDVLKNCTKFIETLKENVLELLNAVHSLNYFYHKLSEKVWNHINVTGKKWLKIWVHFYSLCLLSPLLWSLRDLVLIRSGKQPFFFWKSFPFFSEGVLQLCNGLLVTALFKRSQKFSIGFVSRLSAGQSIVTKFTEKEIEINRYLILVHTPVFITLQRYRDNTGLHRFLFFKFLMDLYALRFPEEAELSYDPGPVFHLFLVNFNLIN